MPMISILFGKNVIGAKTMKKKLPYGASYTLRLTMVDIIDMIEFWECLCQISLKRD